MQPQWQKITKLQKKCIRILFNAKNRTHTGKLFKLADITPADRTFEKEAIKLVYKSITENYQSSQPQEITKLFKQQEQRYRTRLTENPNKLKINKNYKKDQAVYSIINQWNLANNETWNTYRNYGNLYVLKKVMKMNMIDAIKTCENGARAPCKTCEIDELRDYSKYINK